MRRIRALPGALSQRERKKQESPLSQRERKKQESPLPRGGEGRA